ncbi:hydroxyacylglutathione hydrolase [Pseudobacteriovorax antillogorgiicola]|uniref:Hydroxyacylglutathione hydrolase n=1 Tax=Pseudobacteriovorax antillogorgiicola TaxID=1513793 RepID=A0A1Y6BBS6_9BACT|nr:hydroxyacylglutathione hydrolase [Pseudobacteriovorax antillogorgiicola]TCS57565.1 hydroxyacylglutathione hydrolase [Pseudobacteriovorax antillogorgiicola]SME99741.1 hydroxyacylglutathione hydrolase [Pseudobacteriovorax antillogorgiicola]
MSLDVYQLPVLEDNYIYILRDSETGCCAVVDPAEAEPVESFLDNQGWGLDAIWVTHHHWDHTGGIKALVDRFDADVWGSKEDHKRIPNIKHKLSEGDRLTLGAVEAEVIEVSGHTVGHIAFWVESEKALFSGDTLFSLGCGRLFEGSPHQMWASLKKIRDLPDQTRVYCTHEYTAANAKFALSLEPDSAALKGYAQEVHQLRASNRPSIPCILGREKQLNPFLRADDSNLASSLGLRVTSETDVFAAIRKKKDEF